VAEATIRVELDRPIGAVNRHIYGHFIEHLGECIYHGMWAELLQNRKMAGHDAVHYGLVNGWRPVGAATLRVYPGAYRGDDEGFRADDPVRFMHDNTVYYVPGMADRGQSQRVEVLRATGQPVGIGQDRVGLRGGERYVGHVVLRAEGLRPGETGPTRAEVSLAGQSQEVGPLDGEWRRFELAFTPARSDEDALFSITTREAGRLWVGLASLAPADSERGWRRDVNDLIRALKPPIVRYPGGNFASQYHWRDGVGERDRRPVRFDRAWSVYEPNDVGTDEFIEWCRLVGAEPYLCVNTGDGTAEEAAAWVEYCNGPADSHYGAIRAANGHAEPYDVIYWGIGNETYGNWQHDHVDAETYARECVAFARAMRAADAFGARNGAFGARNGAFGARNGASGARNGASSAGHPLAGDGPQGRRLKLLAVGATPDRWPDWNAAVARIAGEEIDYITLHHYARADEATPPEDEYLMTVSAPSRIHDLIAASRQAIDANAPRGRRIPISFDEWNVAHRRAAVGKIGLRNVGHPALGYQAQLARLAGLGAGGRQNYALADGLYAAGFFNVVLRNADHVTMANQAQLVNLLGLIETSDSDCYGTPEYLAFRLYVDHAGPVAVPASVEGPTFAVPGMGNMPARAAEPSIDVAATRDADGRRLWLHVVNRDPAQSVSASVDLGGRAVVRATAHVLAGPHPWARNGFGRKESVRISSQAAEWDGRAPYSFPACSATSLELELSAIGDQLSAPTPHDRAGPDSSPASDQGGAGAES
jgi:alpha-N-arabinofuranosidase